MPRKKVCRKFGCHESPTISGLCKMHSDEAAERHRHYMEAADVLHTGVIDGEYIRDGPLRDELKRLQVWWGQVCCAEISGREHPVLKDETRFGTDWCIVLAQQIADVERDIRAGKEGDTESRKYLRNQTWERFVNLERGLRSNGVKYP